MNAASASRRRAAIEPSRAPVHPAREDTSAAQEACTCIGHGVKGRCRAFNTIPRSKPISAHKYLCFVEVDDWSGEYGTLASADEAGRRFCDCRKSVSTR